MTETVLSKMSEPTDEKPILPLYNEEQTSYAKRRLFITRVRKVDAIIQFLIQVYIIVSNTSRIIYRPERATIFIDELCWTIGHLLISIIINIAINHCFAKERTSKSPYPRLILATRVLTAINLSISLINMCRVHFNQAAMKS
ncbi:hypothetical protein DFJ63DRAFT_71450 [Scheffersomyces coipomensis]|uniref:uncharacterized protein n=1 Tax=Scheffersomyces coipomensis TaxID=1788519 RepID=UPI00315CC93C